MRDVVTLKTLLTLINEGDKESFRNLQKMDNNYPTEFFEVVKNGLCKNPYMIRECMKDDFYFEHKDFFIDFIRESPSRISAFPSSVLIKDTSFAEAAIKDDGANIRDIPKAVIVSHPWLINYAVNNNTIALQCASKTWQDKNFEFIKRRLIEDPRGIKYLTSNIEDRLYFELDYLLSMNPKILGYLTCDILIKHKEATMEAFKKDPSIIIILSTSIKLAFPWMAEIAFDYDHSLVEYIPSEYLIKNLDFCMKCVKEYSESAKYFPIEVITSSKEMFTFCLNDNSKCGKYITLSNVKEYKDVVLEKVAKRPEMIKYINEKVLLDHPDIVIVAVESNWRVYELLPLSVQTSNEDAAQIAYKKNPSSLLWIPFSELSKL